MKKRTNGDIRQKLPIDPDAAQPGVYKWPPHFSPALLVVVFVGGSIGTIARYWASVEIPAAANGWPTATLTVNLLGASLLGLLLEALYRAGRDEGKLRLLRLGLGTGFLGAFTTYGAFAVETNALLQEGSIVLAFCYVAVSVIGGLIAAALGIKLAATRTGRKAAL